MDSVPLGIFSFQPREIGQWRRASQRSRRCNRASLNSDIRNHISLNRA
jgi:hypothetical protein